MKLPLIGPDGVLPPVSEVKNFGLMLDLRDKTIKTYNELSQVVPFSLGGGVDISGYLGLNQVIDDPSVDCPAHVAAGELVTLNDVILHIYYSTKGGGDGLPPPIGIEAKTRTIDFPPFIELQFEPTTASRALAGDQVFDKATGLFTADSTVADAWLQSMDSFAGRKYIRLGGRDAGAKVGLIADGFDLTAGDLPLGSGIDNDPDTLNKVLLFDGTNYYTGEGVDNSAAFPATFTAASTEYVEIVIDTLTGEVWLGKDGVWNADPDVDPPTLVLEAGLRWRVAGFSSTASQPVCSILYAESQAGIAAGGYAPPPQLNVPLNCYMLYKPIPDGTRVRLIDETGRILDVTQFGHEAGLNVMSSGLTTATLEDEFDAWDRRNRECTVTSLNIGTDHTLPETVLSVLDDDERAVAMLSDLNSANIFEYRHAILRYDHKRNPRYTNGNVFLMYRFNVARTYEEALAAWRAIY